ncbi:MAG: putative transport system permease protein [Gaiellales bacterium]|nr:putative transport system permease protein [Gaiellales bacterium]
MLGLTLASLRARPLRALLTAFSIVLGVAMISGTFVVTGQINRAFSQIFDAVNVKNDVVIELRTLDKNSAESFPQPFPASVLDKVKKVPGVAAATGEIDALGSLVIFENGKPKSIGSTGGAPPLVFSSPPARFDPGTYASGHRPRKTGEIALLEDTAKKAQAKVGTTVGLVTLDGLKRLRVSGIYKIGSAASFGGALVSSIPLPDAQRWYGFKNQFTQINVQAEPGVSQTELRDRVRGALGSRYLVQTGPQKARADSKGIADLINGFLGPALLAFGGVAVLVGAFIIFNMFSITVAQRIREIAMLRTIGASRRQILTSVLLEGLVTAVIGSVIGIFAGLLIARGITALFDAAGFGLPSTSPRLSTTGVVLGLVVGLGVTLISALIPAVRATRIPPMAGLREGATLPRGRFARYSPYVALLLALAGAALIANGVTGSGAASQRLLGMAAGAVLVFLAVAMTARFAVPVLARIVGAPLAWRASGALARDNAMRNPARTARTAAALMIGVGLVVFVAVFAAGLRTSFTSALDKSLKSDLIVTPTDQNGGGTLSPAIVRALESVPGVDTASALTQGDVRRNGRHGGQENGLYGIDPKTIGSVYKVDWVKGDDSALKSLDDRGILVEKREASSLHVGVGDRVKLLSNSRDAATVTVRGIYKDDSLLKNGMVTAHLLRRLTHLNGAQLVLATVDQGANPEAVAKRAGARLSAQFPTAKLQSNAEFKQSIADQVNTLLALIYALLGVSVLISLFGIVNTLLLSVYERTREIGMLRAIGMTRRQLRRTIRFESAITAVIGSLLGLVIGVVFGWIVTTGLSSEGLAFAIPWGTLIVCLLGAAIVGILAGAWPAWRASKLRILEALSYE